MTMFLRNKFLGTASYLLAAAGEGDAGGDQGNQNNQQQGGDQSANNDATGENQGQEGDGGESSGEAGEGNGEAGDDGEGANTGDEEDDLAGLTPEQRAKIEARIARETGWRDRQIDRLHRQKREAREDIRATGTIIDQQQRGTTQQPGTKTFTEDDVRREAQRLTAQERYDQGCNDTDAAGTQYYGKDGWTQATGKLAKMGGVTVDDMQAILATDNPAVVLHALSADPDAYERIMALPPARRNNEFVKLGLKEPPKKAGAKELQEDKRPGDTRPPPRHIQGSGRQVAAQRVDLYDDKVSDEAWYEERNKTRRKKFTNVA